jgi:Family of unknown function (DUF6516)
VAAAVALREKTTDEQGNLREMVIWQVEPNPRQPQGIRYRLALILAGEKTPAVLYDNHHPKGHHRHAGAREEPYVFTTVGQLIADLTSEASKLGGETK